MAEKFLKGSGKVENSVDLEFFLTIFKIFNMQVFGFLDTKRVKELYILMMKKEIFIKTTWGSGKIMLSMVLEKFTHQTEM